MNKVFFCANGSRDRNSLLRPPCLCSSRVNNYREEWSIVHSHCIVVGCDSNSVKHKVSFHTILKIISNQGQEHEERTRERRIRWIAAISRDDTKTKGVLVSERVCGRHFVSGRAAKDWDVHNIDLGKYSSRSLKRVMLKQQKLVAKRSRNEGNAG